MTTTSKPIIVKGVRILRPWEYEALRRALKPFQRRILDGHLLTGTRPGEYSIFLEDGETWIDGRFIHLPKICGKEKIKFPERFIRLSDMGTIMVPELFDEALQLPQRQNWNTTLKTAGRNAEIGPEGLSGMTARKTAESWLSFYYPDRTTEICLSQGHDEVTQFKHYLGMPFTDEDLQVMKKWVDGWI